jgi:hypothetical protein
MSCAEYNRINITNCILSLASELMVDVFGAAIRPHARTAAACAMLPDRAAVDVDVLGRVRR